MLFRTLCSTGLALVWLTGGCAAGQPVIQKIEPPDWWLQHAHNPVRLLLTGSNLTSATVTSAGELVISNVVPNAAGTHVFCDAYLPATAKPGAHQLRVTTPAGATVIPWPVRPPLAGGAAAPAGFSPDDVIYLLMPDRFANGDPANDDPQKSPGLFNRAKPRDITAAIFKDSSIASRICVIWG